MNTAATSTGQRILTRFCFFFFLLLISVAGFAQGVAINGSGNPPNASAGLDVDFPDKGLLIPRVALTGSASSAPLPAHVAGMVVYNTATTGDVLPGYYYNEGTRWVPGIPPGNAAGDMLYWNGSSWNVVPAGTAGYLLQSGGSGMPVWVPPPAPYPLATLTTSGITAITGTTATCGGNITADGGLAVLDKGVCWSAVPNPTIADNKTSDGTGLGGFTSDLTSLVPMTTYYVRAYSINGAVISYGNQVSFLAEDILPTIVTVTAGNITSTTATSGGSYTLNGTGGTLLSYGLAYATSPNSPAPTHVQTDTTPVPSPWTTDLADLLGSTTYYIRAYIRGNWNGATSYAYGDELNFLTLAPVLPSVTTFPVTNIWIDTAVGGGEVTDNGGAIVTTRGVCWSTSPNPDTLDSKVASGSGNGSFTATLSPLVDATTYYVRAYAVNSVGVAYGGEESFTSGTPVFNIGDYYGGGVIFYIDGTGQHGLIAALTDQGIDLPYGCSGTVTGATGAGIYAGAANTTAILTACTTTGIAAEVCGSYTGGGFTDWYLPSSGELQEMYNQRAVIPDLTYGLYSYWSSTEGSATLASGFFFYGGYPVSAMKTAAIQMVARAVRAF